MEVDFLAVSLNYEFDCLIIKKEGPEIYKKFFDITQMLFKYYSNHIPSSFYLTIVDIAYKKCIKYNVSSLHKVYLLTFIVRFFIDNFERIDSKHNEKIIPDFILVIIQMTDIDDDLSRKNSVVMIDAFFTMLKRFYPQRIDLINSLDELKQALPLMIKNDLEMISDSEKKMNYIKNEKLFFDTNMYNSSPRTSLELNRDNIKIPHHIAKKFNK